jgi:DNA mismatch repair protein MutL
MLGMHDEDVIDVDYSGVDMELSGFISHPRIIKSNSQSMYTYVNNRSIISSTLKSAISNAYQDLIPHGRYPIVMLYISLPPHRIDVNVHPRKEEVKFANQNELYQLIYKVIKNALINKNNYQKSVETSSSAIVIPSYYEGIKKKPLSDEPSYQMSFIEKEVPPRSGELSCSQNTFSDSIIIGHYQSTYIILEKNNELILLDQHAAAERITYEKLCAFEAAKEEGAQGLLFPEKIALGDRNKTIVSYITDELRVLGFHVAIKDETVIFSGVPNLFFEADLAKLFGDLYEEIEENDLTRTSESTKKAILKTLSCHHSLRAHKNLNAHQIRLLLNDLDRAKHNETCPHGRPIFIKYSLGEVERLFGR